MHGFFAIAPRWVNDTTLVYTGGDGSARPTPRSSRLTSGRRVRLATAQLAQCRRAVPGGGLLFAQLDFTDPDVFRSDLYVQRAAVTRLTHGARLIQPDVRRDGEIIAVQLGPARSTLVRVDALTPDSHHSRSAYRRRLRRAALGAPTVVASRLRTGLLVALRHRGVGLSRLNARVTARLVVSSPRRAGRPTAAPVYVSERERGTG